VLRVKGFAHVRDAAGHLLVQGVRSRITCTMETAEQSQHDSPQHYTHGQAYTSSAPHHGHLHPHSHAHGTMAELVFIGYHLDRNRVVAQLREYTGTAWY